MGIDRSHLVGRDADLAAIDSRLDAGARLVTVVGPGGVGKTRLVRTVLGRRAERGWFCDLAGARDAHDVESIVATTLGIDRGDALAVHLARLGPALIVLDNFEQVASHARSTVGAWVDAAVPTTFLVTSRQPIGVFGEQRHVLEPLTRDDGIVLFRRLTRDVSGSRWDGVPDATFATLVERLDGLPLAIELAASRLVVLSPDELLGRIADRFAVLRSANRDTLPRHASLAAAIDSSYDALPDALQVTLRACAVFRGGFLLADAEHVLAQDGQDDGVLQRVHELVERSLVQARPDDAGGPPRFVLLESIHDYVARLRHGGDDERRAIELRHASRYTQTLAPERFPALSRLSAESANLLAIVHRFAESHPALAVAAIEALDPWLHAVGPADAHAALMSRAVALACSSGDAVLEIRARLMRGHALAIAGKLDDAELDVRRAKALCTEHTKTVLGAESIAAIGAIAQRRGERDAAAARYGEALDVLRRAGDRRATAGVLRRLGVLYMDEGRYVEARAHLEESRAIYESLGARRARAVLLGDLGIVELEIGEDDAARSHLEESLAIVSALGDRRREGIVLSNLALVDHHQGRLHESRVRWIESLAIHAEVGNRRFEAFASSGLGAVALELGDLDEAEAVTERARALFAEVGDARFEGLVAARLAAVRVCRGDVVAARELFDRARDTLRTTQPSWWKVALETFESMLVIGGDGALGTVEEPPSSTSSDRIAARIVSAWRRRPGRHDVAGETAGGAAALLVAEDGAWFRVHGRPPTQLSARRSLRGILARLVEWRVSHAGEPSSLDDLVDAGWPGEKMTPGSARTRLYVAVRTLRDLGLRDVLVTSRNGYVLHPAVPIEVARD